MRRSAARAEGGAIRLGTLVEILLVMVLAYLAFHVGPAIVQRVRFVNDMKLAANAPIDKSAWEIKDELRRKAEQYGLQLAAENLFVVRDAKARRTRITARYRIHIAILPTYTYVWDVEDEVEGYYY